MMTRCGCTLAAAAAAAALALSVCTGAVAGSVERGIVYTPPQWPAPLAADLYRPNARTPVPVVLLVHGGGWRSGRREHMQRFAEGLVARGYAAFSIDYRLAPSAVYPAQLDDLRQALVWLQRHAAERGLDATRIGAWGYSAGAHLAALAALRPAAVPLRAVIAGGLPSDLTALADAPMVRAFVGVDFSDDAQRYREASPQFQISAAAPPMLLYHARWDRVVPPAQAEAMQAALKASGVPNELVWLPARGHILGFYFAADAEALALDFLDRWLRPQPPAASRSSWPQSQAP
jgi:acetyl esterase/lipase